MLHQAAVQPGPVLARQELVDQRLEDVRALDRIGETEVTLKEIVEDSGGDWVERTSSLTLEEVEQNAQKVGQKK